MNPPKHSNILPEEIIFDLLTRLPAKSIGRFRCVSKPWKSLLSRPDFIKSHLNRSKQFPRDEESLILFSAESQSFYSTHLKNAYHQFDEITTLATEFRFDDHQFDYTTFFRNMASCEGLILVMDEKEMLVLINPTTKEIKELPCSPYALDPSKSFTMYGLGYDSVSNDYKVVTISYHDAYYVDDTDDGEEETDLLEMFVNVYSSRNGNWKRAEGSPYDLTVGGFASGVFVDGYIHWLGSRNSDSSSVIVAFDLEKEKFCEVPPPSSVDSGKFVFDYLVALGGCLCLFRWTNVWVMKQYGAKESWANITIIGPEKSDIRLLCMLGKEQVVLVKDEDTVAEKRLMYNLKEGTFKDIIVHGTPDDFCIGGSFVESIVSPHCSNEDIAKVFHY